MRLNRLSAHMNLLLLGSMAAAALPATAVAAPTADAASTAGCSASMDWITNPSEPDEVAASETFCDFYQFSWQWFLSQVSPATGGGRVFETNRLVRPGGGPDQCSLPALSGRRAAAQLLASRVNKEDDEFETNQADGSALYDRHGNVLYYNIWYSEEECQSTVAGFAPGTMELKIAWRVLDSADPTYYTMPATVPGSEPGSTQDVTLGLVGFHLVNWTSKHPEMIWATFEHKTNAPLCDGTDASSGWSLASDAAATCLAENPQSQGGTISPECASFDFNQPDQNVPTPAPPTGTANEICRLYANGNQPGTSVNGNDNAANLAAIQQLNTALVGPDGLLTGLSADNPMAVWQNYEMIGGLWTKDGQASGSPPVDSKQGPANPDSPQRGSLELTNMTMETFEQGSASSVPNCFGCHGYKPSAPLDVSHIATSLLLPAASTGAADD